MAYTRNWDESAPANHTAEPDTPLKMREIKIDVAERLKDFFYGFTSGETDTSAKKTTYKEQSSDPTTTSDCAIVYAKEVSSVTEIFVRDSSGNIKQITSGGKLNIASDEAVLLTGAQTVAGVKTFSSVPVGPASDPSSDNEFARKKYVDDQVTTVDNKVGFSSYSSKSYNTTYQASTDGIVVAYASADDSIRLIGYTDSNATPTTVVADAGHGATDAGERVCITFPVKKSDYWKVTESHTGTLAITVKWMAIGS